MWKGHDDASRRSGRQELSGEARIALLAIVIETSHEACTFPRKGMKRESGCAAFRKSRDY
jgi:hypothetical protein